MDQSNNLELKIKNHPDILPLMKHPDRKLAAEAAIAYLCYGKVCKVRSWRESSSWQRVKLIYDKVTNEDA